jgi:hypothetical protein
VLDQPLQNVFLLNPRNRPIVKGNRKSITIQKGQPITVAVVLLVIVPALLITLLIVAVQSSHRGDIGLILVLFLGALFAMIGVPVLKVWFKDRSRFVGLLRQGQLLPAVLVDANGKKTFSSTSKSGLSVYYTLTIHYQFKNPSGQLLAGVSTRRRNDLLEKPLPEKKTPLAVLYENDNNYILL